MATVPSFPKQQFMVGISRVRGGVLHTRYFYGGTLKEALATAGVKVGDSFTYVRFERGAVQWGEMPRKGVIATTPFRRAS